MKTNFEKPRGERRTRNPKGNPEQQTSVINAFKPEMTTGLLKPRSFFDTPHLARHRAAANARCAGL